MSRMLRILIGAGLIGYGFYSQNYWFFLGLIPLITGLVNWCPMESMLGGCKDGECSTGSCCSTDTKDTTSSCCSSTDENKEVKSSCCATPEEQIKAFEESQVKETPCCSSVNNDTITIKILGIGCANCVALKKVVEEAIKNIDGNFEVIKVEDAQEIMNYQIMSTPGLVINDEVKSVGKLLSIEEVTTLINDTTKCC